MFRHNGMCRINHQQREIEYIWNQDWENDGASSDMKPSLHIYILPLIKEFEHVIQSNVLFSY